MDGIIYLEDGSVYKGKGFGEKGTSIGELVFNTSMTGYQEILTDPSYAGQIITMTYPLIGNYGVNSYENESSKIHARGFIVKSISKNPSNHMSEKLIDDMLKKMNIVGVYDVDTRSITKKIRKNGVLKCVISTEEKTEEELKDYLNNHKIEYDWMKEVSTKEIIRISGEGPKIAVLDFGSKANIINNLKERNCNIIIYPYNTPYKKILDSKPDGLLLSNGPGDPKKVISSIETVKKLMDKLPILGICLGHQILALSVGGDTYKMKYGHRGGNHGIYDIERDKAYITSQNHGYAVNEKSVTDNDMIITHRNLNDKTVEGMRHKNLPIYSVQFHPEGAPGPTDTSYIFDKFISIVEEENICH